MLDAARGAATATATARRRRDDGETAARHDGEIRRQIFGETAHVLACGARCGAGLLRGATRPCGSVRPTISPCRVRRRCRCRRRRRRRRHRRGQAMPFEGARASEPSQDKVTFTGR